MTEALSARATPERLIAPAELRALSRRSDRLGLARLGLHLAVIAAGAALVWSARGSWWVVPAMLPLGWALVALFATVHECIHYTAFRTRRINHWVGWAAAVPSLLNADYYRHFHYAHHRYCQDPTRDPELSPPPPASRGAYLRRLLGIDYWRGRARVSRRVLAGDFAGMDFIPVHARPGVRRSVAAMLALAAAVLVGWAVLDPWAPLLYWIGPIVLAQPILRAMLIAEHTGCAESADGLANTRTTLAAWPVRLLHWNMPYHAEHHLYPSVPFHALPHVHRRIRERIVHLSDGYAGTQRALWRGLGAAG